jgi:hypothetical protein
LPGATEQFQRQGIELRSQQWEGNVDQTTGRRVPLRTFLRTLRSGPSSRQVRSSWVHPTKLRHRTPRGRFAFGWSRFGCLPSGGPDAHPADLVFLAPGRSLRKPPLIAVGFSWISLYSLTRIEIFQWVRWLEAGKSFSRTFALALEAPQREPAVKAMRKRRIVHGASLTRFLIFCNRLPCR